VMKQTPRSKRIDGEDANVAAMTKEPPMRVLSLTMLAAGVLAASSSAHAQTYSPDYPVCLHVYGPATHIECAFMSLQQCDASASGRAAQCEVNPYLAYAEPMKPFSHERRNHRRMHRME
jgi:Protein of unknown function (DUF3551)